LYQLMRVSDFKLVSGVKKKTDTWDAADSEVLLLPAALAAPVNVSPAGSSIA
jgi:hypothetical protein